MWDVGGQATKLWKHYFDHIDAIMFVVDAVSDDVRLEKSKKEIVKLTKDPALENVPILLMLNKQDLKDTEQYQTSEVIIQKL